MSRKKIRDASHTKRARYHRVANTASVSEPRRSQVEKKYKAILLTGDHLTIQKWLKYYGMDLADVEPPSGASKVSNLTDEDVCCLMESVDEDRDRDTWKGGKPTF